MNIKPIDNLTEQSFTIYPIWKLDDADDLYYPLDISNKNEIPDYSYRMFFKANFCLPCGIILSGYVVGYKNINCIHIFYKSNNFIFNKVAVQYCYEQYQKLLQLLPKGLIKKPRDLFPLKYESDLDPAIYKNFSGTFDALYGHPALVS